LKDQVLSLAHRVCADCGWTATTAHHLSYAAGILCPPEYLVALCDQCHKVRHGLSNWRREHYDDYQRRIGYIEVDGSGPGVLCDLVRGKYWKFVGRKGPISTQSDSSTLSDLLRPENLMITREEMDEAIPKQVKLKLRNS
jgi:hypothetical protein